MTRDEATAVAKAISTVDSGCGYCAQEIFDDLNQADLGWKFGVGDHGDDSAEVVTKDTADTCSVTVSQVNHAS